MVAQSYPNRSQGQNADPLKRHACIQVIVRFVDDNVRVFYSRDIDCHNIQSKQWKYRNLNYWVQYWKYRIEKETPNGWAGRVKEGAIFHSWDGNRGDRIAQFDKRTGWQYH
ncbi:hypothetical protein [Tellurirhabdus rosea]|uniref:hypothetical protein n=1 Tax=Tellurirhabdus rosea TaxID=2674997 RepID=UPI00225AD5A7|nr:hypothetical protein [Tellurirhabdus rosea]